MTKVTFFRNNGVLYGFEEEGHSGYADAGEDILCSALSAMTMLIVNTVETSYAADVEYVVSAEETKITVRSRAALPEYESDESRREWKQEVNYEYRKEEAYDNERERDRDDD